MEGILSNGEGKSEEEKETDGYMAVQVRLYRQRRGRFNAGHLKRFRELARVLGFTGSLTCGVAVERRELQEQLQELRTELGGLGGGDGEDEMDVNDEPVPVMVEARDSQAEGSDDEGDKAGEEAVSGLLYRISLLGVDGSTRGGADDE
jgi:hypothetical protein